MASLQCFAFSLLLASVLAGETPPDRDKHLSEKIEAALKASGAASVSVAVVVDGKLAYARAFGMSDIQAHRAADPGTRYAVGSISKEFTAAALLWAQERQKLSLDDKVSKYFPDLTRSSEITIRQLLNHTSGYEDFAPQDYIIPDWIKPTTPAAIMNQWAKKPLNFDPGTRWQYSNTGYVVAGAIFEKATGETLVGFLREKAFEPLGMRSAGECTDASAADAKAYTRYALGPARPVAREASGWYFAAGELCMTPSDLAKWDIAFLARKGLTAESFREFTQEARLANGDGTHYALGLSLGDTRGIPTISHGGEVSGFLALHVMYPTRNGAVIVLSNQDGIQMNDALARDIAAMVFMPDRPQPSEKDTKQAQAILLGLQRGELDRALFTNNANSYFQAVALKDCKESLSRLGELKTVTAVGQNLRGGMVHQSYRAQFEKKTVALNIYIMPDGRYEQFMVVDQP
jgi:D-alanyl-D-alanine carboxypeptidase